MSEELKPCPFCSQDEAKFYERIELKELCVGVVCGRCGNRTDVFTVRHGGYENSAKRWNMRGGLDYDVPDASQARLSEAVKVLEPIVAVLIASEESARSRGKDTDTVPDEHDVTSFSDAPNLKLGHLRAAKAFLATLGEER